MPLRILVPLTSRARSVLAGAFPPVPDAHYSTAGCRAAHRAIGDCITSLPHALAFPMTVPHTDAHMQAHIGGDCGCVIATSSVTRQGEPYAVRLDRPHTDARDWLYSLRGCGRLPH